MARRVAVLLSALVAVLVVPASPAASAAGKRCGTVDLVIRDDPYTKARGIRAQGTSCRTARQVSRAADDRPYRPRYRARRFACKGVEEYGVVYAMHYTCRRDGARIRFRMSAS